MKVVIDILKSPLQGLKSLGRYFKELLTDKEIRSKIFFTLFIIFIYRLLAAIPLPGVNMQAYQVLIGERSTSEAGLLFSGFTGGALETPSIVGLGIGVYITSSIIIQLLSSVVPQLEELTKQGQSGRMKIDQYTRFITLPLAFVYSIAYLVLLSNPFSGVAANVDGQSIPLIESGLRTYEFLGRQITYYGISFSKLIFMALILTAGAMAIMWLAELITEKGVGNGASILITIGILTALPATVSLDFVTIVSAFSQDGLQAGIIAAIPLIAIIIGFVSLFALIVFISESTRKVPIQYARRQREGFVQESHLPLKLNQTGVMPIIFASALVTFPSIVLPALSGLVSSDNPLKQGLWSIIEKSSPIGVALNNFALTINSWSTSVAAGEHIQSPWYNLVYFLMIVVFTLFYVFIAFKPADVAENLQKSGAFISKPAIRPGEATRQYITKVLLRLSTAGAIFLGLIALVPVLAGNIVTGLTGQSYLIFSAVGGTSILIVVSVALDTLRKIDSMRTSLNYDKYS